MASTARMLGSAAYTRMRAENSSEFVPKSVLLAHVDSDSEIDRGNSFWVKAALVYDTVTGDHVDDRTKPVARDLLLKLADACCSRIHPSLRPTSPKPPSLAEGVAGKEEKADETANRTEHRDKEVAGKKEKAKDDAANRTERRDKGVVGKEEKAKDKAAKRTQRPSPQHPDEGTKENKQVIDAIFLVVGFLPRLTKATAGGKGGATSRDAVDESFKATHMQDIVTDVIKLENQLPIKHLLDVVDHVEAAVHDAAALPEFKDVAPALQEYELGFRRGEFDGVIRSFCWYYSPFFSKPPPPPAKNEQSKKAGATGAEAAAGDETKMEERTLLDYLHASLVPHAPSSEEAAGGGVKGGKTSRIPTAKELRRSGVRLEAVEEGPAVVQFREDTATLRLPALVYDFKLSTVARNLLAREFEEQSKPVTRYFQLTNELVDEVADVRILRRAGVVRGGSRGANEVHELIKKIDGYATYPSVFMAIDVQVEKVKVFHEKRMNNFFVRYRPAVIAASSVVAASVVAIVAARMKRG